MRLCLMVLYNVVNVVRGTTVCHTHSLDKLPKTMIDCLFYLLLTADHLFVLSNLFKNSVPKSTFKQKCK